MSAIRCALAGLLLLPALAGAQEEPSFHLTLYEGDHVVVRARRDLVKDAEVAYRRHALQIEAALEHAWRRIVVDADGLRYRPFPEIEGWQVGAPASLKLFVYVRPLNKGELARAVWSKTFEGGGRTLPHILVAPPRVGSGAAELRASCAHEFFHLVQTGYRMPTLDDAWLFEATAGWVEAQVVVTSPPDDAIAPGYWVGAWYHQMEAPLWTHGAFDPRYPTRQYAASVLFEYLGRRFGRDVVRRVWEEHGKDERSLDAMRRVFAEPGFGVVYAQCVAASVARTASPPEIFGFARGAEPVFTVRPDLELRAAGTRLFGARWDGTARSTPAVGAGDRVRLPPPIVTPLEPLCFAVYEVPVHPDLLAEGTRLAVSAGAERAASAFVVLDLASGRRVEPLAAVRGGTSHVVLDGLAGLRRFWFVLAETTAVHEQASAPAPTARVASAFVLLPDLYVKEVEARQGGARIYHATWRDGEARRLELEELDGGVDCGPDAERLRLHVTPSQRVDAVRVRLGDDERPLELQADGERWTIDVDPRPYRAWAERGLAIPVRLRTVARRAITPGNAPSAGSQEWLGDPDPATRPQVRLEAGTLGGLEVAGWECDPGELGGWDLHHALPSRQKGDHDVVRWSGVALVPVAAGMSVTTSERPLAGERLRLETTDPAPRGGLLLNPEGDALQLTVGGVTCYLPSSTAFHHGRTPVPTDITGVVQFSQGGGGSAPGDLQVLVREADPLTNLTGELSRTAAGPTSTLRRVGSITFTRLAVDAVEARFSAPCDYRLDGGVAVGARGTIEGAFRITGGRLRLEAAPLIDVGDLVQDIRGGQLSQDELVRRALAAAARARAPAGDTRERARKAIAGILAARPLPITVVAGP